MGNNSDSVAGRLKWFRWLPRTVFITAVLAPILEVPFFYLVVMELGPKYWGFSSFRLGVIIFYLIIAAIAWVLPIAGGIVAIIATPVWIAFNVLLTGAAGLSQFGEKFLTLESFLLVLGGILSIIWGVLQRRRKGVQQ